MANEIRINSTLSVINGSLKFPQLGGGFTRDQTTPQGGNPGTVTLANGVEEDINFGDVTPDEVFIANLDDTMVLSYGPKSGTMVLFGVVQPGEHVRFQMGAAVTLRVVGDAAGDIFVAGFSA